jgi:cytochrome P450
LKEKLMATTATSGKTKDSDVVVLDMSDPNFMATAMETYAELREEGPVSVVKFSLGSEAENAENAKKPENAREALFNREVFFVSHYDDVMKTLFDERFSVDATTRYEKEMAERGEEPPEGSEELRPLGRMLLNIDPPDHTRIRKIVQPSFTGRGMEAMRGSVQAIVDDLLDRAEREAAARGETPGNRRMELISQFAYPFPVTVISDLLGIPREDREKIHGWTENLLRVDRGRDEEKEKEIRRGLREFVAYLRDLFAQKRREPTDDMISRMVQMEVDGDVLNEDEILGTVFLLYLAGHVTTVNLVGSGVVALLTHPEQLAKIQADPTLSKNMVEETLRYWGPVDFVQRRFATEDIEIAGTAIAKGEQVAIGLAAANHDPAKFPNPDDYDITRPDANRHVAFGRGIHVCLGAPLARLEGQIAFETLVRRYPDLRLAVPADDIEWSGSFLRGFRQVPLIF